MKNIIYNPETHVLVPKGMVYELPGLPMPISKGEFSKDLFDGVQMHQYAMRYLDEAIAAAPQPEPVESEPVIIEEPNYHFEAMGCGLEDRNITDRYEAMEYGWDCVISRIFERIPDGPLYTTPQPDRTAELEAALKVARDALSRAADKFHDYAEIHAAKEASPENDIKVERNLMLSSDMDKALAKINEVLK